MCMACIHLPDNFLLPSRWRSGFSAKTSAIESTETLEVKRTMSQHVFLSLPCTVIGHLLRCFDLSCCRSFMVLEA